MPILVWHGRAILLGERVIHGARVAAAYPGRHLRSGVLLTRFILPSAGTGRRRETLHRLGLLVGVSVVAGLLVAGVALPIVGAFGLAARRGAEQFDSLPSELKTAPLAQRTRILAADGSVIAKFYYENRISVPLSQVAPVMRQAIIAIEDSRFYQHSGVDLKGVIRALVTNSTSGTIRQGGSTITQQYVKNVLIESATTAAGKQAATEDTLARKVREARYAIALENHLSKDQILERLPQHRVLRGERLRHRGGSAPLLQPACEPADSPASGAARRPGTQPGGVRPVAAPEDRKAAARHRPGPDVRARHVTPRAAASAKASALGLHPTSSTNSCQGSSAPFFCDYVEKRFLADPALGRRQEDRFKLLLRGGLDIQTTLDPTTQRAAQKSVDQHVPRSSEFGAATALVQAGHRRMCWPSRRTGTTARFVPRTSQYAVTPVRGEPDNRVSASGFDLTCVSGFEGHGPDDQGSRGRLDHLTSDT